MNCWQQDALLKARAEAERWKALAGRQRRVLPKLLEAIAEERYGGTMGEAMTALEADFEARSLLEDIDGAAALAEWTALRRDRDEAQELAQTLDAEDARAQDFCRLRFGQVRSGEPWKEILERVAKDLDRLRGDCAARSSGWYRKGVEWAAIQARLAEADALRGRAERAERERDEADQERFRLAAALAESDTRADEAERDRDFEARGHRQKRQEAADLGRQVQAAQIEFGRRDAQLAEQDAALRAAGDLLGRLRALAGAATVARHRASEIDALLELPALRRAMTESR